MALVSDIPIFPLIKEIEDKYGEDTHMVIEAVIKNSEHSNINDDDSIGNLEEDDVLWWVEFKNEQKVFDNFAMVRHYFLNEVSK